MTKTTVSVDIVIMGGGIVGLWALNRLNQLGWNTILLESEALGSGQTIKSQGIIHGGMKYALTGFLSDSARAIADMPERWQHCLEGQGEIDLREATVLSPYQYFWSTGTLTGALIQFFASQVLNSQMKAVSSDRYPDIFKTKAFKGSVYALFEMVLDIPSVIRALALSYQDRIFKITKNTVLTQNSSGAYEVSIKTDNTEITLQAKKILLTAGSGNEALLSSISDAPRMQRRPLHMVMVKLDKPYMLFGHCVEQSTTPRITITSHPTKDGKVVWYLGGRIAEEGITNTPEEQIVIAKNELKTLFPWIDFPEHSNRWASFFIDRAESWQKDGKRPTDPFLQALSNLLICWPTKLAFAPRVVDEIIEQLKDMMPSASDLKSLQHLEKPSIAKPIWEELLP